MQQLLEDQIKELKLFSELSGAPHASCVTFGDCHTQILQVVSVQGWILPKACFVQVWFWAAASAKIYNRLFPHQEWNPILLQLNPHKHVPAKFREEVLEWVYQKLLPGLYAEAEPLKFINDHFVRILDELQLMSE